MNPKKEEVVEEKKEEYHGYTTKDIIINVTITLIICLTVLITASIVFDKETEIVVEYKQLELCSLNELIVGQQYEINGKTMILEDLSNNYNRQDDLKLYFQKVK